jgi:hypothetical protein
MHFAKVRVRLGEACIRDLIAIVLFLLAFQFFSIYLPLFFVRSLFVFCHRLFVFLNRTAMTTTNMREKKCGNK